MKKTELFILIIFTAILPSCTLESPRTVCDFNFDWEFKHETDSAWRRLHLPHDWAIEGEFSKENPSGPSSGALPGGKGVYRKHFPTPAAQKVFLEFDGVYMNSTVTVNGKVLGTRPYGYSSFSYDITEALNPTGEDNLVTVECDNSEQPNSRWYAGCGIYRNVRLVTTSDTYVKYHGTYVTTPEINGRECAVVVKTEIEAPEGREYRVLHRILDRDGHSIATGCGDTLFIDRPVLWDTDSPYLYTLRTYLIGDRTIYDEYSTEFGVRSFGFDADNGFSLNGKRMKLQGVCLHHDMGCLGAALHRRALERELGMLQDMGVNAIRTSHNPPAPELLEMCDRMGILVMDEAFDMWRENKTECDYSRFFDEWHVRDLQDFVRRDRNHPCVIMWSIGNEIPEQWDESAESQELARHLAGLVRDMDTTRPVTSGCDDVWPENNILKSGALDVYGFNYHSEFYDKFKEWYPGIPMLGSETASSLNSRGFYPQPSTDTLREPDGIYETPHHQCTSYDSMCAPWADLHEHAWVAVRDRDYMAGTFVWTGFDYLGEPTPYGWPSRSSYFGIVDLAGFPKDIYYMYQSEWTAGTVLHLFPHWNWNEGDKVDVWCYYNNADEVELFVNGKSAGCSSKSGERLRAQWSGVPYEPGKIEAVSYKFGKEVARESVETTGPAASLRLTPDSKVLKADGYDLCYVTVEALDAQGRAVPTACNMLHFDVSGEAELAGVDNGNAADTMCLKGNDKALFNGKALAVVRSIRGNGGKAVLTVTSDFNSSATINIQTK